MKLVQVKSKFGKLRWYYDLPGKEIGVHAIDFIGDASIRVFHESDAYSLERKIADCVKKYEKMSAHICEHCGADNAELCNEQPVFRWISTLCPSCKAERISLYNLEERKNKN